MTTKIVLITGASSGIGLACAKRLHQDGWTVVGTSRAPGDTQPWRSVAMDVDDDDSVRTGVEQILAEHGRIDALVACAGWGLGGAAEETPIEEAKAQVETNFWGVVRVVKAVLPAMRQQQGGRLVLMSSIGGLIGLPFQPFYSASKFALEGYGEALAYEIAPFNVKLTMVEPGNFSTGFTTSRRMVAPLDIDVYASAREKAITTMERDEENGAAPEKVAHVVERVLSARRPPRRTSVGKFDERIGLVAKRLLPFSVFASSAKGSLGL